MRSTSLDAAAEDGAISYPSTSPFDWVGIIGTGQSLSTGCDGDNGPATSTAQPFKNIKLQDLGPDPKYPVDGRGSAQWSAVPLVEPIRTLVPGYPMGSYEYPNNICASNNVYGETPHSGFANTLSGLWETRGMGDYVTAHTVSGLGGACLFQIDKTTGGPTYASGISEARVYKKLADLAGKTYGVGGILLTHGECDSQNPPYNPDYEAKLFQMWNDYNTDIKAVTGQTRDIVLIGSQQSSIPSGLNGPNVQLWRAGVDHPGKIICAGPKYAYGSYGVHMPASGYERIGEKYAEIFDAVVNRGVAWKPLGPNKVTRAGAVLTIDFDVPNPPLVWDTHLAANHQTVHAAWSKGQGFEVLDGSNAELEIASAVIQGNSVVLTLAAAPSASTPLTLSYALTQDGGGNWIGGYPDGMHGSLRDSDDFVGFALETLEVAVTNGSPTIVGTSDVFARRGALDIVTGTGVSPDTVVSTVSGSQIQLSAPWSGATGMTKLTFHHNHYNYCVHFSMAVP